MRTLSVRHRVAALAIAGLVAAPFVWADTEDQASQSGRAYLGVAADRNDQGKGVVLADVRADSPAGKAGLKDGDRITAVDDKPVANFDDLRKAVAAHRAGDKLAVKIQRDGKDQTVNVTLGAEPRRQARGTAPPEGASAYLGVFTQPLSQEARERLNVKSDSGVVVMRVLPNSPAAKAGLQERDVITRVSGNAVNDPRELRQAIEKTGVGKELSLSVARGDKTMDVKATLAEEPANTPIGRERFPEMPEGFGRFQGRMPVFPGQEKMSALEKKVQELEERVKQLEQGKGNK